MEKPPKVGSEITVRLSLTFQEAPDVHTLFAMTPVRQRAKLVRLALERYIAETRHPAGTVDVQIAAISEWLRSRRQLATDAKSPDLTLNDNPMPSVPSQFSSVAMTTQRSLAVDSGSTPSMVKTTDNVEPTAAMVSPSMQRWLNT